VASANFGTGFDPYVIGGPGVRTWAIDPVLRKWYVPQELHREFGWEQWRSSNYARDIYQRYTNVTLEGSHLYDIYGNYITRGWRVYDWSQEQPRSFGSTLYKDPIFSSWFSNLVVSSASRGQYHMALTIGDQIRTTLTPLTFSKPTFNGVQLDFVSDKYALTAIASRASDPGLRLNDRDQPPRPATDYANLIGLRGTAQVGDMMTVGANYVNVFNGKSIDDWADNSLKGRLTTAQNGKQVRQITIRLSDDSPEDGEGGVLFFSQAIYIDGRKAPISPSVKGGVVREGRREASGTEEIYLVYDLEGWSYVDDDLVHDMDWFEEVKFDLVLANDYRVEITSNVQVDLNGQQIFLPVANADDNVKDATNQRVVRFAYGLPTASEILGGTLELTDLYGIWLRSEVAVNRRHRRFPNPNRAILEHSLATDKSLAYYVTAQKLSYPWFSYAEFFSIDDEYSTTAFIPDRSGQVVYDRPDQYWFEMVDDNDDQDRLPDWNRNTNNQTAGNEVDEGRSRLGGIFPGLDENNDFVSDFNQNDNFQPDYVEPFLAYNVDPPEFLYGVDMNNNTVIDRFENDTEPDYPYKRDHRGYNVYVGAEVVRGVKASVGYMRERLISSNRKSRARYGIVNSEQDLPGIGIWRVFEYYRSVKDNIPENLEQWEQPPNTTGGLVPFDDPLAAQDTWINTFYSDLTYTGLDRVVIVNKLKHEIYSQRTRRSGLRKRSNFVGLVNRGHSSFKFGNLEVTPKLKSRFSYRTPLRASAPTEKELWETLTVLLSYPIMATSWIELGAEYTSFFKFQDEEIAQTLPVEDDDFRGLVLAAEYTNVVDYLGYRLNSKIGFRQQIRWFADDVTRTGNIVFVQVFAGLGE